MNVSFYNDGDADIRGVASHAAYGLSPKLLNASDVNMVMENVSRFSSEILERVSTERNDLSYRGEPPTIRFVSIPDHPGKTADSLASGLRDVVDRTKVLYIFVAFVFKDDSMSKDVFGVTQTCHYFINNLEARHACGNQTSMRNRLELGDNGIKSLEHQDIIDLR